MIRAVGHRYNKPKDIHLQQGKDNAKARRFMYAWMVVISAPIHQHFHGWNETDEEFNDTALLCRAFNYL